ncbi:MAG: branched-chain amino acid aminotransferase [Flavobacteriales bacterium]|nr:branched-chain amino acid aminotransferase [Flavobacteriales bacterium]
MEVDIFQTNIQLTKNSRLPQVNWDNLPFGKLFSDHMFTMDFDNGNWSKPKIMPYGDISISPANSAIHYGQSCFEGMKAHRDQNGDIVLFRPYENARRFNNSNKRMCIPEINEDLFVNSILELISIDKNWVPQNLDHSLYIRPFIFASDPFIGIKPSDSYKFMIFTCPVGSYYSEPVSVKVETHYSRAVQGGTGFSKAAGNYAAALYPAMLAAKEGFRQLIWTDAKEHKYIEEAGTMNILFVIDNVLLTPFAGDTILNGITRKSVVDIAKDWGMEVQERKIEVKEVFEALKDGSLTEAFGAGTAATIAPISNISLNGENFTIPESKDHHFHTKVLKYLSEYKMGIHPDKFNWLVKV